MAKSDIFPHYFVVKSEVHGKMLYIASELFSLYFFLLWKANSLLKWDFATNIFVAKNGVITQCVIHHMNYSHHILATKVFFFLKATFCHE